MQTAAACAAACQRCAADERLLVLLFSTEECVRCPDVTAALHALGERRGFEVAHVVRPKGAPRPELFDLFELATVPTIALVPPRAWDFRPDDRQSVHLYHAELGERDEATLLYPSVAAGDLEAVIDGVLTMGPPRLELDADF